jgi:hypothetical protein
MTKKPPLEMPKQPLKYRVPKEGPSPREYELLEFQRTRALTEAEATELKMEQDTRTDIESQWAKYHEDRAAYERAVRSGNA